MPKARTERAEESKFILEASHLGQLLSALIGKGYRAIGPTVRDGAIVYDELHSLRDLPVGYTDEQAPGCYRLEKGGGRAFFNYTVGPQSWKKFLHPPSLRLWKADREDHRFQVVQEIEQTTKFAFLGVRSCELQAILIQDKVFMGGQFVDPVYQACRDNIFVVAVNCTKPGGTCFCQSMGTGPKATVGFDLALTEVLEAKAHYFVLEVGSKKGAEVLAEIPYRQADKKRIQTANRILARSAKRMGRAMDQTNLKELLYKNYEHPRWKEVASRCLSCANCTMACPTCFCTTVEDLTDLTGQHAERWRKWDSCFAMDFSYIYGGSVRRSVKSRYRQWMTHKLATWVDQFGMSGCVGCGRCITWCPVGIDITEEVRAIRGQTSKPKSPKSYKEKN
ncbi:MAG: 4Fe-4S dicluster domain-containing protein [Candidatus Omnitrophica bacterium]|nr:4Fe-4S dicluster domain-containing protein [Candidatus Omnitrophota bacterium]